MLTDAALKHLKSKDKLYKVTDRDGMYVLVRPSGTLTFQLDYRMNGRRETVTFGKYGPAGLSLARARELCIDAKRAIAEGRSPAIEKQRDKRRTEEHTSEHQSLMRNSYAVFCLKKKKINLKKTSIQSHTARTND